MAKKIIHQGTPGPGCFGGWAEKTGYDRGDKSLPRTEGQHLFSLNMLKFHPSMQDKDTSQTDLFKIHIEHRFRGRVCEKWKLFHVTVA